MTTRTMPFSEAKSRHITAARSSYDFQVSDQFLIKSGETVTRKIVKDINHESGSVTGIDPDGGGAVTIKLNPNSPAMDGGEFKYWIDEGKTMPQPKNRLGEEDDMDVLGDETDIIPDVDDFMGDDYEEPAGDFDVGDEVEMGLDDEFGESQLGERDDYDGPGDDDDDMVGDDDDDPDHPTKKTRRAPSTDIPKDESFARELSAFLSEDGAGPDTDQVPNNTVGGGVDDSEHSDEDGEDVEDTPAPSDTIGMEDGGEVQTMAGDSSSNVGGSSPEDEVATHGDTGDSPTQGDGTMPTAGEHEPGEPDKAKGKGESQQNIPRSVREDVSTAIRLVAKGAKAESLAPRLLRGGSKAV